MEQDRCPITGLPCSNPKIIHVTDIGSGYTAEKAFDLCQVCGMGKLQEQKQQEAPTPPQVQPVVKNLFDLLKLIMSSKVKPAAPTTEPEPQVLTQAKPPCPSCGATWQEIDTKSRLGCPECYEHYKTELLPVLIHAHKSAEHVGKHPKPKPVVIDDMPIPEQIHILEMKIKQAADQEQYEKAKELKDKLDAIKLANPQPEPDEG